VTSLSDFYDDDVLIALLIDDVLIKCSDVTYKMCGPFKNP